MKSKLTTFENARGQSTNIDITMTTSSQQVRVAGWHIDPRSFLTDHRLVAFSVVCTSVGDASLGEVPKDEIPKVNLRLIDWKHFDACLRVDLGTTENFDEMNLSEKVETLTSLLQC